MAERTAILGRGKKCGLRKFDDRLPCYEVFCLTIAYVKLLSGLVCNTSATFVYLVLQSNLSFFKFYVKKKQTLL